MLGNASGTKEAALRLPPAAVATLPATFFLDGKGNIIERRAGEVSAEELTTILTTQLGVTE